MTTVARPSLTERGDTAARSGKVAEPYFVTPHAVQRYRERVDGRASGTDAIAAILTGLQEQAPYPTRRPIAIGDRAMKFVAVVAPAGEGQEWPAVVTIWAWSRCPVLLKIKSHIRRNRRYRYLAPDPAIRTEARREFEESVDGLLALAQRAATTPGPGTSDALRATRSRVLELYDRAAGPRTLTGNSVEKLVGHLMTDSGGEEW